MEIYGAQQIQSSKDGKPSKLKVFELIFSSKTQRL